MKIAVCGSHGKMGKEFMRTFSSEYEIIEINRNGDCLNDVIERVELVIDFTNGQSSFLHGVISLTRDVPIIIAATGMCRNHRLTLQKIATAKEVGCIMSSNFSIGMLWIKRNINEISKYFQQITLFEEHHKSKLDSPSGTALSLCEILKISNHAVYATRGDNHFVQHKIILENDNERIVIEHTVKDRSAYMTRLGECMTDIFQLHSFIELE